MFALEFCDIFLTKRLTKFLQKKKKLYIKWYWTKTKFYNFLQFSNITIFLFHFQSYHLCDNVIVIMKLIISMEYIGNKDRLRY